MSIAKEQIRQIISENNISNVADVYTLLKDSFKDILQELLEAEMDATLGYEKNHKGDMQSTNKRNGHSQKNLKSQYGEFQIDIPRDRNGEFEPELIPKYQRDISGIEEKVISLYARGMSTRDIHDQIQDLYGIELSADMVSKITDKILPEAREWQSRPLNPMYPFVFMDCIHYKVREEGRILSRGVDGLPGFKDAIQAVYPESEISNWENNWEDVSSFFQFSGDIRRIMYTTNIIEGLNRQYRKVTKTKSVFPSDTALEKMLYLASENVVKKWTQRYRNRNNKVLNQLIVLYNDRLIQYL